MPTEDKDVDTKATISMAVQEILNKLINSGFGPESSAFCLGVGLSGVLALFQKRNPERPQEELAKLIQAAFNKGYSAEVVPVILPKTPPL